MIASSSIEWTELTWNPTTGCSKLSAGCKIGSSTHQLPIELRGKAAGNYLVKVTQGERTVTLKMVVGR